MRPDASYPPAPQNPALFSSVLVPVDLSENSRSVTRFLAGIPGIRTIILLHVIYNRYLHVTPPVIHPSVDRAREFLETMKAEIAMPGVAVIPLVREIASEDIAECIGRVGREEGCTLVVMSRRGAGIISGILLGSVASDLVRYGEHSLLLLPPVQPEAGPGTGLFSLVLVCTDFSVPEIGSLAPDLLPGDSPVTLFHVVTSGTSEAEVQEAADRASGKLSRILQEARGSGITANSHVAVGSAPEEILSYADRNSVSLIVVKSRGRKGMVSNLIGSTSAPVARNAKKPVLILKKTVARG